MHTWELIQQKHTLSRTLRKGDSQNLKGNLFMKLSFHTYILCVRCNVISSFRVIFAFGEPFLDCVAICRGMIFFTTHKTTKTKKIDNTGLLFTNAHNLTVVTLSDWQCIYFVMKNVLK